MSIRTFHWLALLVLAGCALHQAVYAPVGWNKAAEGTYVLERGDWALSMAPLVIDRSDRTLYPAIWARPGKHTIHVADAEWRIGDRRFPAMDTGYRKDVVSTTYPLDLRWEVRRDNVSLIDGLSAPSSIHLRMDVDGVVEDVDIPIRRIDRY
jgi:hypothetical protein